jgi:hypothetical protein
MSKLDARQWHIWIGLILSLPVFIVGITAIFIAHGKSLGFEHVSISADWLPGARMEMKTGPELKSAFTTSTGERLLATKMGVYQQQGETLEPVNGLEGVEVRGWLEHQGAVYAAAKQGLYRRDNGVWQSLFMMDLWTVSLRPDQQLEAVGKKTIYVSADGKTWAEDKGVKPLLASMAKSGKAEPYTLQKLNMDMHTGKAFFGKEWEVIWIDLVGASCAFLTLTGVWVWWRRRQA